MFWVCLYTAVDQCHSLFCIKFCRNTMNLRNEKYFACEKYLEIGIKYLNKMYNPYLDFPLYTLMCCFTTLVLSVCTMLLCNTNV